MNQSGTGGTGLARPMRSLQIGYDPKVQQQESLAVKISK